MKASELRIGNFLEPNPKLNWIGGGDRIIVVESISENGINYTNYHENGLQWSSLNDDRYTPIPLTEEWLLKFGFEYAAGYADDYTKEPISLYNNPFLEGWTAENLFNEQIKENLLNIKYVHQLQNLYYALTGTELELK